ncbi:hypothetical protein GOB46_22855 [Sinorhizobium meliloti]|uniref:hypothetical protein n=1 Tax=Rhizobium meliloti TaxID=382 RepID=UPI00299EAED4|nr:hypothetical protein [Sinorhizobium meliloti]MDW9873380.1 hypothetical protein [Sinorhizobium meliloti]MDW9885080.1 hypothetical protein [Sinorhizobium meliloti]
MWLLAIFKWATGGPLSRVLSSIEKSIDNETERQRITANVVERAIIADAEHRAASMQSRVFWFVWALFAVPVGVWLGAVCVDSVLLFSGSISDLPPSVKPYATQIITSIFGSGAGVAGVQAIAAAIRGRK